MKAARRLIAHCLVFCVIALTNVGFAWTLLGCSSGAIRLVRPNGPSFEDMLDAQATADARRPAHWMGIWVRGDSLPTEVGILDPVKLPEPYADPRPSLVLPAHYHLGYAALRLIREHYAAAHSAYRVLERGDIVDIVDAADGNLYSVDEYVKDRRPDIADVGGRFVFEVVPPGPIHRDAAKKTVDWYLWVLNRAMLGVPAFRLGTGYSGEVGVRFTDEAAPWKLAWKTTEPGVVQYAWHVLAADHDDDDDRRDAYLDNRWRDPTALEISRFARALHEVVERLVQRRESLGRTRAADETPILPGKTLVEYQRWVVLWSDTDESVARLLPIMREPPPVPERVRRDPRLLAQTVAVGGGQTLLTTRELRRIYGNPNGLTGIQYNRDVGLMFQRLVLMHMPGPKFMVANSKPFASPVREQRTNGKRKSVIPDGVAGASIGSTSPFGAAISTYPESTFIEVKAVKGNITRSYGQYQIDGMLDVLSHSQAARSIGEDQAFPNMYFVTTGDTIIGPDVIQEATRLKILLWLSYVTVNASDDVQVAPATCLNCTQVLIGPQVQGFALPGLRFRIKSQPAPRAPVLLDPPILDDGLVGDPGVPGSTTPNP